MIFSTSRSQHELTEQRTVEIDGAEQVEARIIQSVGELYLSGGATTLLDGTFTFPEHLRPIIEYRVMQGIGKLLVDHERPRRNVGRTDRMRWDIRLHDQVPLNLTIDQATGTSRLDLSTLQLDSLKVAKATGATAIDLSGNHPDLQSIKIDNSTGTLDLKLNGRYQALESLKVDAATGEVNIDMSGSWQCSLDAKINTATGSLTLRLPNDVGAEVNVKAAISKVNGHGMWRDGSVWRNAAFGTAQHNLRIRVSSSIANVTLEVAD
jgi:hypothetical protein